MRFIQEWIARMRIARREKRIHQRTEGAWNYHYSVMLFWLDPVTYGLVHGSKDAVPPRPSKQAILCHCVVNERCGPGYNPSPNNYIISISLHIGVTLPGPSIRDKERHLPPSLNERRLIQIARDIINQQCERSLVVRSGGWKRLQRPGYLVICKAYGHHGFRYPEDN
jgi:hypothetical protein